MQKPAIPQLPGPPERSRFDSSLKETLEVLTGARGGKITPLESNAGLSDVITKINEILAVLQ
jgi:hypothetical protein